MNNKQVMTNRYVEASNTRTGQSVCEENLEWFSGGWAGPYHAGSGTSSTGTDHDVRDVAAPVFLALLVGQQRQGGLL